MIHCIINESCVFSLDHFDSLLQCYDTKGRPLLPVNYDIRKRNTAIENCKEEAMKFSIILTDRVKALSHDISENEQLDVHFLGDSKSECFFVTHSTFFRELAFVSHHGIHHLATVKLMMQFLGCGPDDNIGVANSTLLAKR